MGMKLPWDAKSRWENAPGYDRVRSADPYHTNRWTRLSKAFRSEPAHVLCASCKQRGIIREADVVDHITPWPICGIEGFYDRANLQPLCNQCNIEKGNRDKKAIAAWKKQHQNQ